MNNAKRRFYAESLQVSNLKAIITRHTVKNGKKVD